MLDFNFCSIQSPFKNGAMKEMQQIDENPFAQFKSNTNRNGDTKVLSEGLHVMNVVCNVPCVVEFSTIVLMA